MPQVRVSGTSGNDTAEPPGASGVKMQWQTHGNQESFLERWLPRNCMSDSLLELALLSNCETRPDIWQVSYALGLDRSHPTTRPGPIGGVLDKLDPSPA